MGILTIMSGAYLIRATGAIRDQSEDRAAELLHNYFVFHSVSYLVGVIVLVVGIFGAALVMSGR